MLLLQRDLAFDRLLEELGVGQFHYRLYLILGVLLSFEYLQSIMLLSFLLPALEEDWGLSGAQETGIAASGFMGMMCGALLGGVYSDRHGRKKTIERSLWVAAIGNVLSVICPDPITLALARSLIGWGSGALFTGCYALFSEVFCLRDRTKHIMLVKLSFTAGSVLSVLFAWVTLGLGAHYRLYLLLCALPCVLMLLFVRKVPESPRWLLANGFHAKAQAVLDTMAALNGVGKDSLEYDRLFPSTTANEGAEERKFTLAEEEEEEGEEGVEGETRRGMTVDGAILLDSSADALAPAETQQQGAFSFTTNLRTLLLDAEHRSTSLLCMLLFFVIAVTFYATSILTPQFFSLEDDVYAMSFVSTIIEVPGRLLPLLFLDRGRKVSLLGCFMATALAYLGLGLLLVPGDGPSSDAWVAAALSCVRLMGAMLMGVSYLYVLEVFDTNLRATAVGLCAFCGRIGGVLAALLVKTEISNLMFVFCALCLVGAVASSALHVETNNRIMR